MTLEKQIAEGEYFKVKDGPSLPGLLALRAYLRMMPQHQFEHHAGQGRNDFADWTEHVFGETGLAKRMRATRTREEMVWLLDDAFAEARMGRVIADQEVTPQQVRIAGVEMADAVALQEDAAFDPHKDEIVSGGERIIAKYDDIAKRMQEAIANPVPRDIEQRIERLRSRYQEVAARISEARRQGRDALIPALMLKQFNPKLSLAMATREEKDFAFAGMVLDQVEFELKEVMEEKILDVKKEVLAMAGLDGQQARPAGAPAAKKQA